MRSRDRKYRAGSQLSNELIAGRRCFVVMPFGDKKHPITGKQIDFDAVYQSFIKPAVEALKLDCVRSDEVSKSGLIHREMIEAIISSDVVLVDITTGNANVMYELGIRHAAKRWGTIILREAGPDAIPFNISGLRAIDYQLDNDDLIEQSRQLLETNIRNCLFERNVDSLVHTLFPGLNVTQQARPIPFRRTYVWEWPGSPGKQLCIVTGDITNVDMVDLWVNPENTSMQMGRYHDNSISSLIRYYGAQRDRRGSVKKDSIVEALNREMGKGYSVEPGTVIVTPPGRLQRSNKVMAIVHIAAQHGEPGRGYSTVRSQENCVMNALDAAEWFNYRILRRLGFRRRARSILFPLFGTRASGDDPQMVTFNLVQSAKVYLETWPDCPIEKVYFLAYTDTDEEYLLTAFQRLGLTFKHSEPEEEAATSTATTPPSLL